MVTFRSYARGFFLFSSFLGFLFVCFLLNKNNLAPPGAYFSDHLAMFRYPSATSYGNLSALPVLLLLSSTGLLDVSICQENFAIFLKTLKLIYGHAVFETHCTLISIAICIQNNKPIF